MQLYVLTVLMDMNCEVCRDLVAGLRGDLEALDYESLMRIENQGQVENLLLWMLLVGGGASPMNKDRGWFVRRLGMLGNRLGLKRWEDVEARLENGGWPWRRKYCGAWRMAWRDAVLARKDEKKKVVEVR